MPTDFEEKEPTLRMEAVERRGEPRGLMHGVRIVLEGGLECEALEASRKGFFAAVDDPEAFKLGTTMEVKVLHGDRAIGCRAEVVRKEIHPRCGVALRIAHIAPVAEETLKLMLGE